MNFPKTLRLPLVAIGLGLAGCTGAGPALEDQSANLDPHGPDLVVTAIATPPSFLPGDNTQGTVTACNNGEAPAPPTTVNLYLSLDANIRGIFENPINPDYYLAEAQIPPLQSGECTDVDFPLQGWVPSYGAYYLGAVIDEQRLIAEANEQNNHFTGRVVGVGSGPDLVVRSIHTPPSSTGPLGVDVEICNDGTMVAFDLRANVYLSSDEVIEGIVHNPNNPDWFLGQIQPTNFYGLAPGRCFLAHGDFFAPLFTNGPFYVGAIADEDNTTQELIEENNVGISPAFGLGFGPDLRVSRLDFPIDAERHFEGDVTICNQGTANAPPGSANVYFSSDTEILGLAYGASGDPFAGTVPYDGLNAGECRSIHGMFNVPVPTDGVYYAAAIIDEDENVTELMEDNNTFVGQRMGIGFGPDLVVKSLSGRETALPGSLTSISLEVCNYGASWASGTEVEIWDAHARVAPHFGSGIVRDFLLGTISVPGLDPGRCLRLGQDLVHSAPEGTYVLAAVIDPYASVPELQETNNLTFGNRVGVGFAADLVVSSLSAPPNVQGEFRVEARVCNQGTAQAGPNEVHVYFSPDRRIDGIMDTWSMDWFVAQIPTPPLMAGQCARVSQLAYGYPFSAPPIYFGANIDEFGNERELLEDNNTFEAGIIGVGFGADLVVRHIATPPSSDRTQRSIPVEVCNQGTSQSNPTTVNVVLSPDRDIDWNPATTQELFFGSAPVDFLPAGQCRTVSVQGGFWAPSDGIYYLGAQVDPSGSEAELREENNTLLSDAIGIGFEPDLVIRSLGSSYDAFGGLRLNAEVCNQGTVVSSNTEVQVALSTDAIFDDTSAGQFSDFIVGFLQVQSLEAGRCARLSQQVPASAPPGAYYLIGAVDAFNAQPELIETNNIFVGGRISVGPNPDLTVTEILGPPSTTGAFEARVRVCNLGAGPSSGNQVTVYLSDDETLEPSMNSGFGDSFAGTIDVPQIEAGECVTASQQVFAPVPSNAAYHLAATVNELGNEPELVTENNAFVGGLIGVGFQPDLVVTSITAPPVAQNEFVVEVRICNQGTVPAGPSDVAIIQSADQIIEDVFNAPYSDLLLNVLPVPPLQQGQCTRVSQTVHSWGAPGAYYLAATVDPTRSQEEFIESNNTFVGNIIGFGPGPDLVIEAITGPASSLGTFTVSARVCNQGFEFLSGSDVNLFVSADRVLDENPVDGDFLLGLLQVPALPPHGCATVTRQVSAPVPQPGTYYLLGVADPFGNVPEVLESNNRFVGNAIGLGSGPDLRVSSVVGPSSALSTLNVSYSVCNQGTAPAAGGNVGIYLSSDNQITGNLLHGPRPGSDQFVGTAVLPSLAVGRCTSGSISGPTGGLSGAYYLGAIVDELGEVTELNEENNTLVGALVGLGSGPDLVVSSFTGPASTNGNFTGRLRVCNRGTISSAPATVNLYLSADATIEGNIANPWAPDPLVGSAPVPTLAVGQCASLTQPLFASVPTQGPYYLGAIIDEEGQQPELIEQNNTYLGALIGVGNAPDLVVTSIRLPTIAYSSRQLTVSYTACNQGTTPAPGFDVSLYFSTDNRLTGMMNDPYSDDRLFMVSQVPPLAAGACTTVSVTNWPPVPPGSYYFGAIADEWHNVPELIETNNDRFGYRMTMRP